MRSLLAIAAFLAAGNAFAANDSEAERQKISLALDFCAGIVAQDTRVIDQVIKTFPGLQVGPAKPLGELVPEPTVRELFSKVFQVEESEVLRFAAFYPEPTPRKLPYAAFKPEGDICIVVGPPDEPGSAASVQARLGALDSGWSLSKDEDSQLWKHGAPLGETVTLGLSSDEMMIIVALAQRPISTQAEIAAITQSALQPCVESILNVKPPDPAVFGPAFTVVNREPGEKTPEVVRTTLRSQVAGPRSMLSFNTWREYVYCELWTSDGRQPTDDVLAAVVDTITAIPGIKEIKVKPKKAAASNEDHTAVLRSWQVARRGAARKVNIDVGIREKDIVVVTLEHTTGWLW